MYNLSLHIEYLLLRQDCVVVPGVGAFINSRHSARYDRDRGEWLPMSREVCFNPALTHDDGSLATSYARKNQMDFQEGRELMRKDASRLSQLLASEGEVTIGSLGILRNESGALSFTPLYTTHQWSRILGYYPAECAPSRRSSAESKTESSTPTPTAASTGEPVSETTVAIPAEEPQSMPSRKFDTDRNYYIAVNKIFARTAACFAIVMAVVISLFIPRQRTMDMNQASVLPVEHLITDPREQKPAEHVIKADIAFEDVESSAVSVDPVEAGESEASYYVIVGTFMSQGEAEKYMTSHNNTSYPLTLVASATRVRVAAYSSDNRQELLSLMNADDFRKSYPESWIWSREK
ncbi:MAG: hypothetical protein K2N88_03745 [Muribaculaceae bacterium]|nr:hypothetical protein [Muribaculaceae bacterium]